MPRIKKATDASGNVFYPASISNAIWDTDSNQRLSATLSDIRDALWYNDVYVGAASTSPGIATSSYYHETVMRGRPITITNADDEYLWVILPARYTPVVIISGLDIPMEMDSTTTISSKSYKIWKSSNIYSGTFNVYLF